MAMYETAIPDGFWVKSEEDALAYQQYTACAAGLALELRGTKWP